MSPDALNERQMFTRMEVCSALLLRNKNDPFLDRIITCDERRVRYGNSKKPAQWVDKDEPPRHMPKSELHPRKVTLTVWWSATGIFHHRLLPRGKTVTAESYSHELEVAYQKLKIKHPALIIRRGPLLLHDNARPNVARTTFSKLSELGVEALPHPHYSSDHSPTDFHLLRCLDSIIREKQFDNEKVIEMAFQDFNASRKPDF
ncbi:Histone-lysine N-methyltransferase SETMAR, partial [Toxocara canis]